MSELRSRRPTQTWSLAAILGGVIVGLFLMRFFLVAESAGQGETAWVVGLWMLAWFASSMLNDRPSCIKPGWLELSIGMLVGGHILSALVIFCTTGEKRSAVNLAWEWCGVAAGWFLLRQCSRHLAFRSELIAGLLAVGTTVAGFGLYQHYFEFPQMAAHYGPMFDKLKQSGDPAEAAAIRKKMAEEQIPVEGPAFTLFEKRLRDSREPLGLFALANTFGGFLAVCLILVISTAVACRQNQQQRSWRDLLIWVLPLIVIGWCLLLTKSRTAWIGTAVGLAFWSLGMGYVKVTRTRLLQAAILGFIVILIGWGLGQVGGLDRQVLTEAPKSLEYRLQYWSATWPMIIHHPWMGVGLGQFRSNYLLYKLPQASEEISDPHNLFLDVAANGGTIALVGLLAFCFLLAVRFRQIDDAVKNVDQDPLDSGYQWGIIGVAIAGWCAMIVGNDDRLLVLIPIAVALYRAFRRVLSNSSIVSKSVLWGATSAGIALIVHLCGAGGIEMPAISLLLLCMAFLGEIPSKMSEQNLKSFRWRQRAAYAVVSFGLLIGVGYMVIWPVSSAQREIAAGDRLAMDGRLQAADKKYEQATHSDTLTDEPWRRRAELAFQISEKERFQSGENFQKVVSNLEQAQARDPLSPHNARRLGEFWMAKWRVTHQIQDAREAVASFERAWHRYPTNGILMAELADANLAAEDRDAARNLAVKAMKQDQINHERGHVDRYLPDAVFEKMKKLSLGDDPL